MKKNFLYIFFCCFLHANAQEVVQYGDTAYMFNSPQATLSQFLYKTAISPTNYSFLHYGLSQAYHANKATWIYGIAVTKHPFGLNDIIGLGTGYTTVYWPAERWNDYTDSIYAIRDCHYVMMHTYNPGLGTLQLVKKQRFEYPSPIKHFVYHKKLISDTTMTASDTVRCIELYFDSPIMIADSFFIGTTALSSNPPHVNDSCMTVPHPYGSHQTSGLCGIAGTLDSVEHRWIWFPDNNNDTAFEWLPLLQIPTAQSEDYYCYPWGYVFPILYPREDGCTAPVRPWVVERGETWVTLEWDTLDGPAELAFGTNYNGNPDTMTGIVSLAAGSTGHTIANLQPGTIYGAWLRRECHWVTPTYDTTVWSPWSPICLINTAGTSGIGNSDEVSFTLSPNPAHSTFNIRTDCLPATLTLYDPQGRTVYTTIIRSHNTTIGIGDLTRGVYHVSLSTTNGRTSTRRLVVE